MFPPLFLGGMMDEPAGSSAPPAPPAPTAPPPAPIQRMASQGPNQPPQWLQALPALFAIGARLGGSPTTGTGALLGAQQADVMAERQRAQRVAEDQRQQQIGMQQQQMLMQQQAYQERIEQQKQAAIGRAVDDLRVQPFKTRAEYEQAVTAYENLINQQYPIRPNTLRTLVPFKAPDVQGRAYKTVETLTKQDNWQDIVATNGLIKFDRDGDGTPESVKVSELIELGNFPIATDPQTGKPMLAPKEVKAENVQDFDLAYQGVLGEWQAEGKNVNDPVVKGKAATEARFRLGKASRQATTSIVMPSAGTQAGMLTPNVQRRVDHLSDAFRADPTVKKTNIVAEAVSFVQSLPQNSNSPADDQALIYAFAKAMDPDSVVREGEYAVAQKYAQSWLDNFGFNAIRVLQNREFLTPLARSNMKAAILKKYQAARTQYDNVQRQFAKQINQATGMQDGAERLINYAEAFPSPDTGQSFTVQAPNGKTYSFATQEQANKFKAAAGIK